VQHMPAVEKLKRDIPSSARKANPVETPECVTVTEATRILRKHKTTVRRMLQDGDLLGFRLSARGRLWIVKESLETFLREEKAAHLFETEERRQMSNARRRRNEKIREQWRKEAQ